MADWTTITDSQVDPKAPVTSELMTALRDNPVAIAQGATNAPKIADSWRVAEVGGSTLVLGDIELGEGARITLGVTGTIPDNNSATVHLAISSNNGASYPEEITLGTDAAPFEGTGLLSVKGDFLFDRLTGQWAFFSQEDNGIIAGTFTSPNAVTDIRIRISGSISGPKICALWYITGGKAVS